MQFSAPLLVLALAAFTRSNPASQTQKHQSSKSLLTVLCQWVILVLVSAKMAIYSFVEAKDGRHGWA
ncbi:hypothetical protein BDZ45DRAFT_740198 [Acephala macrosclerotiorum]|nr:hypothetical protein BDZ45DRAFT_740198 [Acephala macrosclerotiorum]